jgi:chitinase
VLLKQNRLSRGSCLLWAAMASLWLFHGYSYAQSAPADTTPPINAAGGFLQSQGAQPRFEATSKLSSAARDAMREDRVSSVPHFSGSFALDGKSYPYTMVGSKPQSGGTTTVPVQIVPISMFFEEFVDESGSPIVLDPAPVMPRVQSSPNFHNAPYTTGMTQFADAVQRAQFHSPAAQEWHTLLSKPETLKPLRIVVPRGLAKVYRNPSTGVTYAIVDTDFFLSQLNTIIQLENLDTDALAIALTSNVFLAPQSDIKKCCVLGFHTSFDMGELTQVNFVQTFIWASWVDPGILGSTLADVTPMSHEISEWMNNPFGSNVVPAWQVPNSTSCQNNLETGDPLATMPNAGYTVLIDGFTYHPQSQVLLQWFQRGSTSDAIDGAFSFPDQTLMTGPSQACPAR